MIHRTPCSQSVSFKAVRHQGSRFDPSRCSSFCSPKLFRWLVDQSYIILQHRPCLSHCSINVTGVSSDAANDLTGHHLLVSEIPPLIDRIISHHPSHTILSVPPLQHTFENQIGCAVLDHQQSIPLTLHAHSRESVGIWIILLLYPLAAALRHVLLRCGGSGMLVGTKYNTLWYKTRRDGRRTVFFLESTILENSRRI